MPRPWRIVYSGARYHVTSRGNGRQMIFYGPEDYDRFIEQLTHALEQDEIILYAYVLMPNHYHLLIETPLGNIKRFMQRLNTAYGMYCRYKHSKPGHCFQGRYKAKLVGGDDYIVRLTRYLHLNPIKIKEMRNLSSPEKYAYLKGYEYSSYLGYTNKALEEEIINYRWLSLMHRRSLKANRTAYSKYIREYIAKDDQGLQAVMSVSRYAIGDEEFVEESQADLKGIMQERVCGCSDVYLPRERLCDMEEIEKAVAKEFKISVEDLRRHGHCSGAAKGIALELCCQLTGKSQREIGNYFGYSHDSSVSRQRKNIRKRLHEDRKLNACMTKLKNKMAAKC